PGESVVGGVSGDAGGGGWRAGTVRGNDCGFCVMVGDEPSDRADPVGPHVLGAEVDVPQHIRVLAVVGQVVAQLGRILPRGVLAGGAGAVGGLPDEKLDRCTGDGLGPPSGQRLVVGDGKAYVPIDLGRDVVDPALFDPLAGVGENRV